jgi:hypothetical protein
MINPIEWLIVYCLMLLFIIQKYPDLLTIVWLEFEAVEKEHQKDERAEFAAVFQRMSFSQRSHHSYEVNLKSAFYWRWSVTTLPEKQKKQKGRLLKVADISGVNGQRIPFELTESGKCRREHGNGQEEGRLSCQSLSYVNHSVCFSKKPTSRIGSVRSISKKHAIELSQRLPLPNDRRRNNVTSNEILKSKNKFRPTSIVQSWAMCSNEYRALHIPLCIVHDDSLDLRMKSVVKSEKWSIFTFRSHQG